MADDTRIFDWGVIMDWTIPKVAEVSAAHDDSPTVPWYPCASCGAAHDVPHCPFPEVPDTIKATVLVDSLRSELALLRGAMVADDEREQQAGVRCGVPQELHACDWPDAVADEVLSLRQQVAEAQHHQNMNAVAGVNVGEMLRKAQQQLAEAQGEIQRLRQVLDAGAVVIATATYYGHQVVPNLTLRLLTERAEAAEQQVATLVEALEKISTFSRSFDVVSGYLRDVDWMSASALDAVRGET